MQISSSWVVVHIRFGEHELLLNSVGVHVCVLLWSLLVITSQTEVEAMVVVKQTVPALTMPGLNVEVDDMVDEEVDEEEVDVDVVNEVVLVTEASVVDDVVLEILSDAVDEVETDVEEVEDVVGTVDEASWEGITSDEATSEERSVAETASVVVNSLLVISLSVFCLMTCLSSLYE